MLHRLWRTHSCELRGDKLSAARHVLASPEPKASAARARLLIRVAMFLARGFANAAEKRGDSRARAQCVWTDRWIESADWRREDRGEEWSPCQLLAQEQWESAGTCAVRLVFPSTLALNTFSWSQHDKRDKEDMTSWLDLFYVSNQNVSITVFHTLSLSIGFSYLLFRHNCAATVCTGLWLVFLHLMLHMSVVSVLYVSISNYICLLLHQCTTHYFRSLIAFIIHPHLLIAFIINPYV